MKAVSIPKTELTLGEAASVLSVSLDSLRSLERCGLFRFRRTRGGWRTVNASDLDQLHRILRPESVSQETGC
ncbi:MAG: helix-turn-helix domain-containing protein [Candidatus Eisenbacteria bacterium]|uniref:Helix-turn-helix domain-containing protein n=1 Tax=Eiseniibacteriota bacterium TaxID=2212470 RepID=A0A948S0Z7_UNCEI|nr:helix-turn-helix domain-containing protein [Candidatus Eisenbacteria bacterium]MBU1948903.1 helix-turn-helix domain-containing protein [Candidatus Eisenbacteria bacterium]MBU2692847.1 helix-turn-helix domain-containing protein [Candidatus Eisenbacteria bacterium]